MGAGIGVADSGVEDAVIMRVTVLTDGVLR
jgi:hypothetical protein